MPQLPGAAGWVETNDTIVRPWDISRLALDTFGGQQGLVSRFSPMRQSEC